MLRGSSEGLSSRQAPSVSALSSVIARGLALSPDFHRAYVGGIPDIWGEKFVLVDSVPNGPEISTESVEITHSVSHSFHGLDKDLQVLLA